MGINRDIFNAIKDVLWDYRCYEGEIKEFLITRWGFLRRQTKAISIVEKIMTDHGKKELLQHVVELARVEQGIRKLEPWARDHVVHALLSFLLGIHINEDFLKPSGCAVEPFQWKLAGLLHDIGYPVPIGQGIIDPYTNTINRIKGDIGAKRPDVFFKVIPVGFDQLSNGVKSLDLIQGHLNNWGLEIDASSEYENMIKSGRVCHGIISSLSVLYIIDLLYDKYNPDRKYHAIYDPSGMNWNQSCFENDVVPACSAIFVHNLPDRCFTTARLDRNRAPLAFLLRLSDCLQDWQRPSADNPRGIPNSKFKINIDGDRLVFSVADEDRRNKIKSEIESSLLAPDVEVC